MEGRDGGRGSCWRYRKQTGGSSSSYTISSGSSSSDTIVSTAYTSNGSHLSSISMEAAAMHLDSELEKMEKDKTVKQIESLVDEFWSAQYSTNGGDISVLKRWFTELRIGWVLHLADPSSGSGELEHARGRSWILALAAIMDTIRLTTSRDDFLFARFTQDAMSKMLTFVDSITSEVVVKNGLPVLYVKLSTLLGVHGALSKALSEIKLLFPSPPSAKVGRIESELVGLLSANKGKAGEAIWSTMEDCRSRILELQQDGDDDDSFGAQAPRGPPGIHKASQSMKSYIMLLWVNYLSADAVVFEAANLGKYVPRITDISPLDSMITEMIHCIQDKLVNMSESFLDQGLRFLFLLNNSHFMLEALHLDFWIRRDLDFKVKAYMKSYLQVSWVPVVSCLFDLTPLRLFGKNYSPLLRFESKFQKTYTTQKLWKVPDPELRNGLRTAITEKIIPDYTKYITDNKITTARIAPQELGEMLRELFEG